MVHLEVCFPPHPHPLAPDNPTASATSLVTLLKILQTARAVVFSPIAWGPALYGLHFFGTFISFIPPHISSSWEPKEAYNIVLPSSILSSQAPYEICNLGWVCMTGLLLPKEASMVERGIWTWDSQPLIWYPDHRSIRACYLWANREALGPWSLAFLQRNKVKFSAAKHGKVTNNWFLYSVGPGVYSLQPPAPATQFLFSCLHSGHDAGDITGSSLCLLLGGPLLLGSCFRLGDCL